MSMLMPRRVTTAVRKAYVTLVIAGGLALLSVQVGLQLRLDSFNCPRQVDGATAGVDERPLSSITWELAGTQERVLRQLHPASASPQSRPLTVDEMVCVQARGRFIESGYETLDKGLFMPVYAVLSLLLAVWVAAQDPGRRRTRLAAASLVLATAVLLGLDVRENSHAIELLQAAERGLASLTVPVVSGLDAIAQATREASLAKWAASAVWSLLLAWVLWCWRPMASTRKIRWVHLASLGLLLGAAALFATSAAKGWHSEVFAVLVDILNVAMSLALAGIVLTAIAIGFTPKGTNASGKDKPQEPSVQLDAEMSGTNSARLADGTSVREFHLEEYRQIRGEVTALLGRIETLFRASIVATATAFALVASNGVGIDSGTLCLKLPPAFLIMGWLVPPIFVLCTGLAALVAHQRINEIAGYLLQLERSLGAPGLGWEAHLHRKQATLKPLAQGLWLLILALAVAGALIGLLTIEQASGGCSLPA